MEPEMQTKGDAIRQGSPLDHATLTTNNLSVQLTCRKDAVTLVAIVTQVVGWGTVTFTHPQQTCASIWLVEYPDL